MKPGCSDKADTSENRGLRITCGATGIKTFFYRYTSPITHKLTQVKIGHFPNITLAQARAELQMLKLVKNEGRCPASELKAEKSHKQQVKLAAQQAVFTVKDLVELYLTERIEDRHGKDGKIILGARNSRSQYATRRTLTKDVVEKVGDRAAQDVTRKDVIELVMAAVQRGANVLAGSILRELCAAYEFALGLGKLDENFANPALLAKASIAQAKVKLTAKPGKRVLSESELAQMLDWLPNSSFPPNVKNVLWLTLLTGCRTGEICALAWENVDLQKGTIHLKETKTGSERHVQLSKQAIDFLKSLRDSSTHYLFTSRRTNKPITQYFLNKDSHRLRELDRMIDIPPWTPHDLRRTVRTGLARLGCPSEVAEAVLGHSRKGIEGTYDLYSYEPECKVWLQKWADYLDTLKV
ncbi:integrase [Serratia fonticola]|uniref:Tyrosine-type recombinase/integrase n=2 Tax=Serratia fonticola TaxID=47917 RepID=A0AAW3WKE3_SERFO|nr:integrase [Serratia fonticola]MBC3210683.1 tyrosine-type recombinase/integrase [Serratia fonticola]NYA11665.1 tyrosine-type recombinase/integrase [Serratia fonticola]NYA32773.1 tyrosine-type recombinase/integrase [Serratia fonticola]